MLILKVVAASFVFYEVFAGEAWWTFRYSSDSWHAIPQRIYRDETPGFFWGVIAFQSAILTYLFFR